MEGKWKRQRRQRIDDENGEDDEDANGKRLENTG